MKTIAEALEAHDEKIKKLNSINSEEELKSLLNDLYNFREEVEGRIKVLKHITANTYIVRCPESPTLGHIHFSLKTTGERLYEGKIYRVQGTMELSKVDATLILYAKNVGI